MKKVLLTLAAVAGMFCSCTKDLENRVAELEKKFADLEAKVNANAKSISDLVAAAESGVTINSVAPASDGNGYVSSCSDGTTAVIVNGINGFAEFEILIYRPVDRWIQTLSGVQ